jgi:TolB-like protein
MMRSNPVQTLLASAMVLGMWAGNVEAQSELTIAVLPFEDRGSYGQDKEVFRALELGIPSILATELAKNPRIRLADQSRLVKAVEAENLGEDARMDAATAGRIGSQAGARYALTGTFADFYGKFRVDARLVDVGSGQIVKVVSNNDLKLQDRADLHRIIQDLSGRISAAAGLPVQQGTPQARERVIPTEALTQYSFGLLSENAGDKGKARDHYQRALTAFPDFVEAREGMQRSR